MDFSKEWEDAANCRCSDRLKPLERRKARQHQRCLAHSLVGTPNYIAPEVLLRTGTVDDTCRLDLGFVNFKVLYFVLSGGKCLLVDVAFISPRPFFHFTLTTRTIYYF